MLAPTGKAVDEAMRDGAGDRGLTVAKALQLIEDDQLHVDRRTVIVIDEASMVGTPELQTTAVVRGTAGRAKMVLVGDAYQLAPVKARGGMFEQLCDDLPWSQRLGEVWRMRDPDERDASLALRSGHGNRLRKAVGWYRNHDRLHTGDPIAMAADATTAYITARAEGKDAAIICDTWEIADAINQRLHDHYTDADAPSVRGGPRPAGPRRRLIISRRNDATIDRRARRTTTAAVTQVDQVRNGNRWRVVGVDAERGRIAAERLTDQRPRHLRGRLPARAHHPGLRHHRALRPRHDRRQLHHPRRLLDHPVRSRQPRHGLRRHDPRPRRKPRSSSIQPITSEADHEHHHGADAGIHHDAPRHQTRRRPLLPHDPAANDDRARTMHAEAERTDRDLLPPMRRGPAGPQRPTPRRPPHAWRQHSAQTRAREAAYQRITATRQQAAAQRQRSRGRDRGYGPGAVETRNGSGPGTP